MSEHVAEIEWSRGDAEFTYEAYPRDHRWTFDGSTYVEASAAPDYRGTPSRVDPEEAFVAAVASCHMLTFLAIAARKRRTVESYRDRAIGHMEKNDEGRLAITRVVLRPEIRFAAGSEPDEKTLTSMHHSAHDHCFIANSIRTEVTVE